MKKSVIVIIGIVLLTILLATSVSADSFSFILTPDKTQLKPGEELTLELNVKDIDVGELGINAIEAVLSYDEAVFEKVSQDDFTSQNNWTFTYNDEDTENKGKMLAMILSSGVKDDQTIGKIVLKVKENVKTTDTKIEIKDIATNNSTDMITCANQTINLKVEGGKKSGFTADTMAPVIICVVIFLIMIVFKRIRK